MKIKVYVFRIGVLFYCPKVVGSFVNNILNRNFSDQSNVAKYLFTISSLEWEGFTITFPGTIFLLTTATFFSNVGKLPASGSSRHICLQNSKTPMTSDVYNSIYD